MLKIPMSTRKNLFENYHKLGTRYQKGSPVLVQIDHGRVVLDKDGVTVTV
jgi:hypothetical protein